MGGKFIYAFGEPADWPDKLKCLMCPFCEISTSCDVNINIHSEYGGIYLWCKSCGARSICDTARLIATEDEIQKIRLDVPLKLSNVKFFKFELKFINTLSSERNSNFFRTDNIIEPSDIIQFFAELHDERKFNMETFIKNNKIAKKYKIKPTPGVKSMLVISVNSHNLSCPSVSYPKNIDLLWDIPIVTCIQGEYYLHRFFPWGIKNSILEIC